MIENIIKFGHVSEWSAKARLLAVSKHLSTLFGVRRCLTANLKHSPHDDSP